MRSVRLPTASEQCIVCGVSWQNFSLRFNQQFANGYRFLDKCGEFMVEATEQLDLLPGDINPTGANLVLPEEGIRSGLSAAGLEVIQENSPNPDLFIKISLGLAELAHKHFGPLDLDCNTFEVKTQIPMQSEEAAGEAMLKWATGAPADSSKALEMTLESQRIDTTYASGSQRLRVSLAPVAYETVRVQRHNPVLLATKTQKMRANRLTRAADRWNDHPPYAIFLEASLMEFVPAPNSEKPLFDSLMQKLEVAKKLYPVP